MNINIIIADDHKIVRDGIRSFLEKELDIKIIGEAENGEKLISMANTLKPDIVLLDISMPHINGVEATKLLKAQDIQTKILIVSMHNEKHYVNKMLKLGVSGYILKNSSANELVKAIRRVYSGKKYLSPDLVDDVINNYHSDKNEDIQIKDLLEREIFVIKEICEGKTSKEIAFDLELSKKSIDLIRSQIMEKLNLQTTADLIKFAIRHGITELE